VLTQQDVPRGLSASAIRRICDRNRGVGSDGILLLVPSAKADFGLRIFNPDGSEAEKSGNGLRIFAKYLSEHGHAKSTTFTVETKGGIVECVCHAAGGRIAAVTVEMGRATFRAPEIPMNGPDREVVGVPLEVAGTILTVTAVSVGNPHCVVFVPRLDEPEVRRLCGFSGSREGARPEYAAVAGALGRELTARGIELVYGGGSVGLMGALADAVMQAGGRVVGVIPGPLASRELAHSGITELRVV